MEIGLGNKYPTAMDCVPRQISLTENLENRKVQLEAQLLEINQAIEALEKNPELQGLLDVISKVRY